jgi:peptidoglycan-associated lipoprotein
MLLKSTLSILAFATIMSFTSCSDDKKVQEPVAAAPAAAEETPAAPSSSAGLRTDPIYFGFDDYTLSSEAQAKLTAMADAMKANKTAAVQIQGHCDERGTIEYNLALGERRAASVKTFLTQLGIEAARLSTISFGEEKPVSQGHSESDWSQNRRAEFALTSN